MSVRTTEKSEERADRRAWLGLAVLCLPTVLVALDSTVLLLALPHLTADLGATGVQQLWITDVYGFMVAGLVITMGTLGDRIGRRRLLLAGVSMFALASLLAAYASGPAMLIAARALLGITGATLMPATLGLITNMFRNDTERGRAISVWATCNFTGAAIGPVVGGLLLNHFWWGSVFLLALPVAAVVLVAGPPLLPEFRAERAGRLDPVGVLLSILAVLPVVYGIKVLATGSGPASRAGAALLVGAVFGAAFARRQLRSDHPLLDLRLFARGSFGLTVLALLLTGTVLAGAGMLVTQYLQTVLGFSPLASACWFAPMGLAVAAGTMSTPALVRKIKPGTAIAGGLALSTVGGFLLAVVDAGSGALPAVVAVTLLGLGTGPLFALGTGLVVDSVPPERAGSAAAMVETSNFLGTALGIAALGTIGTAIYRDRMGGAPTAAARETVAGAAATARDLPADAAADLLRQAHAAFTSGLNLAGAVATIVLAFLAALATALFRRRGGTN